VRTITEAASRFVRHELSVDVVLFARAIRGICGKTSSRYWPRRCRWPTGKP